MSKIVYLLRHAETVANFGNTHQSDKQEDDPLTPKGLEEAHTLAERVSRLPVDVLFSSDLHRARQTAEIVAQLLGTEALYSPLFAEKKRPSSIVGKPLADESLSEHHRLRQEHSDDPSWHFEDEENFFDTRARAEKGIELILGREEKNIAIVTHGYFLRFLFGTMVFGKEFTPAIWKGIEFGMRTTNTGITVMQYGIPYGSMTATDRFVLLTWNDHAHLG